MPSHGIWPTLGKIANVIGIVWALVALGVLGYYREIPAVPIYTGSLFEQIAAGQFVLG